MIPRDPDSGQLLPANPFDNDFIAIGDNMAENQINRWRFSQPQISYEAYVNSYANFLDMVLQGIMSPSTLGIDLKKTDNSESQREKEKVTLYVRNKIVDALNDTLPNLFQVILQCYDLMCGKAPEEYDPSVKFGEYASPDFDSTVDTIGKGENSLVLCRWRHRLSSCMETPGHKMKKDAEVERLKAEQGIVQLEEPGVNQTTGDFAIDFGGEKKCR